jgi:hypothetical protein
MHDSSTGSLKEENCVPGQPGEKCETLFHPIPKITKIKGT